jgi:iron complex outermembrane receptor protein
MWYGNLGYTYRIPTFTDLNYKSPTTIGNSNLEPEKAFSQELFEMEYI